MKQQFDSTQVLRLEIERPATGLRNMIKNPNGEKGAWGWVTPVSGTTLSSTGTELAFDSNGTASHFMSEEAVVVPGRYIAARVTVTNRSASTDSMKIEFLDAGKNLIGSTPTTSIPSTGDFNTEAAVIPANSAYAALRIDATGSSAVPFRFNQVTLATADTAAELTTTRTNLITNPSFETNSNGWVVGSPGTLSRQTSGGAQGTGCMRLTAEGGYGRASGPTINVEAGQTYTMSGYLYKSTNTGMGSQWPEIGGKWNTADPTDAFDFEIELRTADAVGVWHRKSTTFTVPLDVTSVTLSAYLGNSVPAGGHMQWDGLLLEKSYSVAPYFDGSTTNTAIWTHSWDGTAHASTSKAVSFNLQYVEPIQWRNILGESHEIKVIREELNVGTLTAEVLNSELDPATTEEIRPGRYCRVQAQKSSDASWDTVFEGRVTNAQVEYVPRTRITLTASDAVTQLANAPGVEGVESMDDLRYVLEGAGTPWLVNGNSNQKATAVVVARNENASVLDQVAITRDVNNGYAWVSRTGVLVANSEANMPTGTTATISDLPGALSYSHLDVNFNTEECINSVRVKFLRYDSATGETEEVMYGPYENPVSIAEWGFHGVEFTIQKATESASAIEAFANAVLTKNAEPVVRVRSATLPVRTTSEVEGLAFIDLYDRVDLTYSAVGLSGVLARVVGIEHTITPGKWQIDLKFGAEGFVALPQRVPAPGKAA